MAAPELITQEAVQEARPVKQAAGRSVRLSPGRGILRGLFRRRQSLRVLCYHGVIADELAGEPWVPDYFVTETQFREQMQTIQSFAEIVRLADIYRNDQTPNDTRTPRIAVTFDDVPACAFTHARPILKELGIPATFFVATGLLSSNRPAPAEMVHLLRLYPDIRQDAASPALNEVCRKPSTHKSLTIQTLQRILARVDRRLLSQAPREAIESLRLLSWSQLHTLVDEGHEVGGHTVDHAILSRQTEATREQQVARCLSDIQNQLGVDPVGFAYPNGGPGDFSQTDTTHLRAAGFKYAVTTIAGFCSAASSQFELPRVCIGMGHTPTRFMLEVSGLLDRRRRRQQGWN
ncbi:MAG: polysaccharide deacetylase family protein [Planctomycetes bacterium]|nr:polysaccharide deacetylase family protein [Planctomycetota bacterium]